MNLKDDQLKELSEKVMNKFVTLRHKTYSYPICDNVQTKNPKETKKFAIREKIIFVDLKTFQKQHSLETK